MDRQHAMRSSRAAAKSAESQVGESEVFERYGNPRLHYTCNRLVLFCVSDIADQPVRLSPCQVCPSKSSSICSTMPAKLSNSYTGLERLRLEASRPGHGLGKVWQKGSLQYVYRAPLLGCDYQVSRRPVTGSSPISEGRAWRVPVMSRSESSPDLAVLVDTPV